MSKTASDSIQSGLHKLTLLGSRTWFCQKSASKFGQKPCKNCTYVEKISHTFADLIIYLHIFSQIFEPNVLSFW